MNFNDHSDLNGEHSFLSPSNYHWINYSKEKLESVYLNQRSKERGTILHDFASTAVKEKIKLANHKKALNMFVNDCIGFKMESEQVLYYSRNAFGTADAISFRDNVLRIFDLKTGITRASFKQLDVYVALFCLEYGVDPKKIEIETRIYQGNGFEVSIPEPDYIFDIMNTIEEFDIIIDNIRLNDLR